MLGYPDKVREGPIKTLGTRFEAENIILGYHDILTTIYWLDPG
jgi:hypothetical protein